MRIGLISMDPGIPVLGGKGASIHLQSMARAFTELGADVTLISPRIEGSVSLPVRTIKIPLSDGDRHAALRDADSCLAAIINKEHFDLVYERHALHSCAGTETARQLGIPNILEVNAPLLEEQALYRTLDDAGAAQDITRRSLSAADTVIAVTSAVAAYAHDHGAARVEVIPNAVPADRQALPRHGDPCFTVGFLGSLRPWHDLETLLTAMEILQSRRNARLLIIGDGPERKRFSGPLGRIGAEITGMVPHSEVPEYLARIDVGTAIYSAHRPFYFSPLKLFDYMAAERPAVASDIGDLGPILTGYGLVCPPDDPAALACTLEDIARHPTLAHELGRAGRAYVMTHHTWEQVARRALNLSGFRDAA